MGGGILHYFRNYVVDNSYPVPDDYMTQIQEIIKFLETRNELRSSFAKRHNLSEYSLRLMINFYNNHKKYSLKVENER